MSFTETFDSSWSPWIASRAWWYAFAIDSASAASRTSSPRTSTVAYFPSAFRLATV